MAFEVDPTTENKHHEEDRDDADNGESDGDLAASVDQQPPEENALAVSQARKEKLEIQALQRLRKPMFVGQVWYLLDLDWFEKWQYYSDEKYNAPRPGAIDNTNLLEEGSATVCKKGIYENYEFVIVSEEEWQKFHEWYGGGPPLPRKVIQTNGRNLGVEVRPLLIRFVKSSAKNQEILARFSKSVTVGEMKKEMCKKMGLIEEDVRVWDYHARNKVKRLDNEEQKICDAYIIDDQLVLLEEKGENGQFERSPERKQPTHGGYHNERGTKEPTIRGTTGLNNLGNTCFMNSSLQCASHCIPLLEYFLSQNYKSDINTTNVLGQKGEFATAVAHLFTDMYSGEYRSVAPREFKQKLERFAPQFSGYQQHDSQELLAFLLDGLHEDLNRVKQKPYIESKDSEGREDEDLAMESWQNHKLRNDSFIVDLFQGQLKSTLVCPVCSKISITFDPFMCLSLQLPLKFKRAITITMAYYNPLRLPTRFKVQVEKYENIAHLKKILGEMAGVDPDSFVVADVFNHRMFKVWENKDKIESIQERDVVVAYELVSRETAVQHYPYLTVSKDSGDRTNSLNDSYIRESENDSHMRDSASTADNEVRNSGHTENDSNLTTNSVSSDTECVHHSQALTDSEETRHTAMLTDSDDQVARTRMDEEDPHPPIDDDDDDDYVHVKIVHKKKDTGSYVYNNKSRVLFGQPFFLSIPSAISYQELYRICLVKLQRYLRSNPTEGIEQTEEDVDSDSSLSENNYSHHPNSNLIRRIDSEMEESDDTSSNATRSLQQSMEDIDEVANPTIINTAISASVDNGDVDMYQKEKQQRDSDIFHQHIPLFTLIQDSMNSFHSSVPLHKGDIIRLNSGSVVGLDWNYSQYRRWYRNEAEEEFDVHPSARKKINERGEEIDDDEIPRITLDKCLEAFVATETLGPDDPWYCNRCKVHREATKKMELWSLPKILVVFLKRFSYQNRYYREKLDCFVEYPINGLDLSKYQLSKKCPPPIYDLFAVSNHFGSLGGGHYTAFARNGNKWFNFDDSCVSEISENKVVASSAYVLFYKRRDTGDWDTDLLSNTNGINGSTHDENTNGHNINSNGSINSSVHYHSFDNSSEPNSISITTNKDDDDDEQEEDDDEDDDNDISVNSSLNASRNTNDTEDNDENNINAMNDRVDVRGGHSIKDISNNTNMHLSIDENNGSSIGSTHGSSDDEMKEERVH